MTYKNCFICAKFLARTSTNLSSTSTSKSSSVMADVDLDRGCGQDYGNFIIRHILDLPELDSARKSQLASANLDFHFCDICNHGIMQIKNTLEELEKLEKQVMDWKYGIELKMKNSQVEEMAKGADQATKLRCEIVKEISKSTMLRMMDKIRNKRIGQRPCPNEKAKVVRIMKSVVIENKILRSSLKFAGKSKSGPEGRPNQTYREKQTPCHSRSFNPGFLVRPSSSSVREVRLVKKTSSSKPVVPLTFPLISSTFKPVKIAELFPVADPVAAAPKFIVPIPKPTMSPTLSRNLQYNDSNYFQNFSGDPLFVPNFKEENQNDDDDIIEIDDDVDESNACWSNFQTLNITDIDAGFSQNMTLYKNERNVIPGDCIVLTKPLGTQIALKAFEWINTTPLPSQFLFLQNVINEDCIRLAYLRASESMARSNENAASLAENFNAHGAIDVCELGLLGHAEKLAKIQTSEVSFVIHNLPIISKMSLIDKAYPNMFKLSLGRSPETSGGLLIVLPRQAAAQYCKEFEEKYGYMAWIVGTVETGGNRSARLIDKPRIIYAPAKDTPGQIW